MRKDKSPEGLIKKNNEFILNKYYNKMKTKECVLLLNEKKIKIMIYILNKIKINNLF